MNPRVLNMTLRFCYGREFFDWITQDKGYARKLTEFGEIINPAGMREIKDYPNLTVAMEKRGWHAARVRKPMSRSERTKWTGRTVPSVRASCIGPTVQP